ncbi:hypothetical protein C725_2150 [Pacificimonas flava]|uniref:Uncharacterized protein n=1 Tax=Pacificimonas flava TaxID=1234595 RepID=M2T7D2_9SPHN|nr:hypothetical protein C725_2150 [Pacificimonas flava]
MHIHSLCLLHSASALRPIAMCVTRISHLSQAACSTSACCLTRVVRIVSSCARLGRSR